MGSENKCFLNPLNLPLTGAVFCGPTDCYADGFSEPPPTVLPDVSANDYSVVNAPVMLAPVQRDRHSIASGDDKWFGPYHHSTTEGCAAGIGKRIDGCSRCAGGSLAYLHG